MKKIFAILPLVSVLVLSSCNDQLDKVNQNPNNLLYGDVHPSSLLPNILFYGAQSMVKQTYTLSDEIIQYTVSANTLDAYHRYQIPNGIPASLWANCARWAANADHMRELSARDVAYCNYEAIAITMKVYFTQIIVDSFGDIPYDEAFQGYQGVTKPEFNTTEDIYKRFIEDLEYANSKYDISGRPMSEKHIAKDYLYGGDLLKWQKFTNSLLLRVLIRCSDCEGMQSREKLQEIYNNSADYPVFESNDDAAVYRFTGSDNNLNPYGSEDLTKFVNARRASEFMINQMDGSGDPRISLYYVQVGGAWKGAVSGVATRDEAGGSAAAKLNKDVIGDYNSPYSFMNYDEVLFIWAEAAQRGIIQGGSSLAKDYYNKAIEASIRHWSDMPGNKTAVTPAAISQFIAKVAYDDSYEQLMTQKFVALFWVGFEPWAEYRRTEYPLLKIAPTTLNDQILPRRFEYPVNTGTTNPDNYSIAVQRMATLYGGADDMKTPLWWSKYRRDHFNK